MQPEQILEMIKIQTGLDLKPCDHFSGVHKHRRKKYFNVILSQNISESIEYDILKRFANKYKMISVEPNGLNRVAIFF